MPNPVKACVEADSVVLELNRLQNQIVEKETEIGKAQTEIRASRAAEVVKDKAIERLEREVKSLEEQLDFNEKQIEQKNVEIKKLIDVKKEALASQYAAEATLRRVYADQKDDDTVPIESIIAPLEAELRTLGHEFGAVQEDKRALERLMISKEAVPDSGSSGGSGTPTTTGGSGSLGGSTITTFFGFSDSLIRMRLMTLAPLQHNLSRILSGLQQKTVMVC